MTAKLTHLMVPLASLPPEVDRKISTVVDWVTLIAISICILGVIIAGAMMAIGQRRGEGGEHAARLGWVMAGCIVIGTASAVVNALV
ncbi:TrbC/VIRB2 family protein [Kribbella amoyensis]|uniref:TrbC/VIRB2 family protein n=1 Tax=Kribbella amoyensis TaxID=996641 RepID=A0A561BNW8_9ACTN|nr:TrbC/VirB2 family protein [Kribbella amoyensis]TWD80502.1 TrbC/VIRB2 family protein [Kribbella amoyensis]